MTDQTTNEDPARKPTFVLTFQVEKLYETPQIVARICTVTPAGELRNAGASYRSEPGCEYGDFAISCYPAGMDAPYGLRYEYRQPYAVDRDRAEAMVKLLRKVDKGMEKLRDARGYVGDWQFDQYALRVAEVLGITQFYVRNGAKARQFSGQSWRRVDGSGVQDWVRATTAEVRAGTYVAAR